MPTSGPIAHPCGTPNTSLHSHALLVHGRDHVHPGHHQPNEEDFPRQFPRREAGLELVEVCSAITEAVEDRSRGNSKFDKKTFEQFPSI